MGEYLGGNDQERERELDKLVSTPPSLPSHLSQFNRRGSRVDPNVSPSDKSSRNLITYLGSICRLSRRHVTLLVVSPPELLPVLR